MALVQFGDNAQSNTALTYLKVRTLLDATAWNIAYVPRNFGYSARH